MQATKKCTRSTPSVRSTPSDRPEPAPLEARARRRPANAFADPFLEKLRLVVRVLEGAGAESPTEAEAALSGPLAVEKVRTRGGSTGWAVVRPAEPIAEGGKAAALSGSRAEALRLAAVLPAVPKLNPYHLSDRPTGLGWPLHVNRHHVGHVSRLSRGGAEKEGKAARRPCSRQQVLLTHLHLARYLAANPEALAQVIESAGPEALAALGRALARRIEAALDARSA